MSTEERFEDYVHYLRENLVTLVEYRERTGTLEPGITEVKEALFNEDPFIVYTATLAATALLADKSLYH